MRSGRTALEKWWHRLAFAAMTPIVTLSCLSPSFRSNRIATLRLTVEVRSASGPTMAGYPILASTRSLGRDPGSSVSLTDKEGRIEVIERRTPNPESFRWTTPVRPIERLRFYLPEVHREGMYCVSFLMDRTLPSWGMIERDHPLVSPDRIEPVPGSDPGSSTTVTVHGAGYSSSTGAYRCTKVLADGEDRRRVPLTLMPSGIEPVPREPMLEVTARSAPLVDERGYELNVEIMLLEAPDKTQPRGELLAELRALREGLAVRAPDEKLELRDLRSLDIALLAGATRDELLVALGQPEYCAQQEIRGSGGSGATTRPYVPCDLGNDDLIYLFHHPPANRSLALEGDWPELVLKFGDGGRCNASSWDSARYKVGR